jgi:hypothetical protein
MFNFFKLYKPKEYGYRPIYYDPKKEAAKERIKQAAAASENSGESNNEFKSSIHRGSFRELADQHKRTRLSEVRKSNTRLVIIIAILFLIMYFLLT